MRPDRRPQAIAASDEMRRWREMEDLLKAYPRMAFEQGRSASILRE